MTIRSYRGVALPLQYWKVVAMVRKDGKPSVTAYLLSQESLLDEFRTARTPGTLPESFSYGAYRTFQVPVRRIAGLTGLDLAPYIAADPLERSRNDRTATRTRATRAHPAVTTFSLLTSRSKVRGHGPELACGPARERIHGDTQRVGRANGRVRDRADRRCRRGEDDARPAGDAVAAATGAVGGRHRIGAQHPARSLRAPGGDRDVPGSGGVPVSGARNAFSPTGVR